jgi:SAF domain
MTVGGRITMSDSNKALLVDKRDNVATAFEDIPQNTRVTVIGGPEGLQVTASQNIAFCHKIAMRPIGKSDVVVKYGLPIGFATAEIAAGDWVHCHNVRPLSANPEAKKS